MWNSYMGARVPFFTVRKTAYHSVQQGGSLISPQKFRDNGGILYKGIRYIS